MALLQNVGSTFVVADDFRFVIFYLISFSYISVELKNSCLVHTVISVVWIFSSYSWSSSVDIFVLLPRGCCFSSVSFVGPTE